MRLELVFVPSVAASLAFAVARLLIPVRAWLYRDMNTKAAVLVVLWRVVGRVM
jgi:hypothetical protein